MKRIFIFLLAVASAAITVVAQEPIASTTISQESHAAEQVTENFEGTDSAVQTDADAQTESVALASLTEETSGLQGTTKDGAAPLLDEQENFVYHSEIMIGDYRIMMADNVEPDTSKNTSFFLTVTFDSADDVKKAYEVLKDGCTIIHPMRSTTYSSCTVSLIDKFGVRWGLMTEQTEK